MGLQDGPNIFHRKSKCDHHSCLVTERPHCFGAFVLMHAQHRDEVSVRSIMTRLTQALFRILVSSHTFWSRISDPTDYTRPLTLPSKNSNTVVPTLLLGDGSSCFIVPLPGETSARALSPVLVAVPVSSTSWRVYAE